jgi:hypothetical protein
MSNEEINRAIAEHLGWTYGTIYIGDGLDFDEYSHAWRRNGKATLERPPNYCSDLNAIRSVVLTLDNSHRTRFVIDSGKVVDSGESYTFQHRFNMLTLGPREMSITFLRAVGKWAEDDSTVSNP